MFKDIMIKCGFLYLILVKKISTQVFFQIAYSKFSKLIYSISLPCNFLEVILRNRKYLSHTFNR